MVEQLKLQIIRNSLSGSMEERESRISPSFSVGSLALMASSSWEAIGDSGGGSEEGVMNTQIKEKLT